MYEIWSVGHKPFEMWTNNKVKYGENSVCMCVYILYIILYYNNLHRV